MWRGKEEKSSQERALKSFPYVKLPSGVLVQTCSQRRDFQMDYRQWMHSLISNEIWCMHLHLQFQHCTVIKSQSLVYFCLFYRYFRGKDMDGVKKDFDWGTRCPHHPGHDWVRHGSIHRYVAVNFSWYTCNILIIIKAFTTFFWITTY